MVNFRVLRAMNWLWLSLSDSSRFCISMVFFGSILNWYGWLFVSFLHIKIDEPTELIGETKLSFSQKIYGQIELAFPFFLVQLLGIWLHQKDFNTTESSFGIVEHLQNDEIRVSLIVCFNEHVVIIRITYSRFSTQSNQNNRIISPTRLHRTQIDLDYAWQRLFSLRVVSVHANNNFCVFFWASNKLSVIVSGR